MKTMFKAAVLAATTLTAPVLLPAAAHAQAAAPAVIVIVDMSDVIANSAAGKGAQVTLQAQATALQTRYKQLGDGFQAEEAALGKAQQGKTLTEAAFDAKVRDLQTRQQAAGNEVQQKQRALQQSQAYVVDQIDRASQPIITAIMKEKNATIALARGATIQASSGLDITQDVVRRLDTALPRVSTTPPAGQAAPAATPTAPAPARR